MKTLVLDSHPLVAYFEKEKSWERIAELLQRGAEGECRFLLTVVNWGEIYYITLREYGEEYAERVRHAVRNMPIQLVDVDQELALRAARLKAGGGLSYADCFAVALAEMNNVAVVTGDKEFREVERKVRVHWIK